MLISFCARLFRISIKLSYRISCKTTITVVNDEHHSTTLRCLRVILNALPCALTGIYFVFITILCFLSVAMTIVVIHLYTNSVAALPPKLPGVVSIDFTRVIASQNLFAVPWLTL